MAMLKTLGNELINIHGQQDNQMLMSSDNHRRFIDSFAGLEDDLTAYRAIYEELCKVQKELGDIHASESFKAQRMDMLSYQVAEIDAARLAPAEEEELLSRQRMLKNAERISGALYMSRSYLEGDGQNEGIIGLIDSLGEQLRTAERYIDSLSEGAQKVETMRFELEELQRQLRDLSEELEFDENELDRIGSRLDLIYRLKKKYGRSLEEVIAYGEKARAELDAMTDSDQRQAALLERSVQLESEARKRAEVITEKRTQGTDRFAARLRDELQQLAMPSVRLLVSITPQELGSSGADRVEFLMSPNPGEEPKPLSRIASGGENSRTMLAVKSVLADCADIDTLIFDEVDAGIGGRAAQRVGLKLKEVSRTRQVICVTHLAQVAAYADNHLLIEKQVVMDKTFTSVRTLDRTGRIGELARMSAGERLTELALKNAEEMLTLAAEKG
jgi:DNA repair protein RecN (Recombination protein N)